MIPAWLVFALEFAPIVAAGLAMGPTPGRRAASLAFVVVALVLPWLAGPEHPFVYALIGLTSLLGPVKWLDHARDRRVHPAPIRAWDFLTPFDVRQVERVGPRLDVRAFGSAIFHAVLCAAGLALVWRWPDALAVRVLGGATGIYGMVGGVADAMRGLYALAGFRVPPIQRWPALSRSAGEFWGRRWNRYINEWLSRHFFWPLARRRHPALGVAAAFVASAAVHWWLIGVAFGLLSIEAAWMVAFFLVQGLIVLIEGPLRVRRWPAPAAHAWTLAALLLPSALFVEPFLRLLRL